MNSSKPIYWHQGLFLQPQHFQQQELFLKSDFNFINRRMTPFYWGTFNLELNHESLKNNIIEITKGKFIFQDDTIAEFPENSVVPPRAFDPMEIEQDRQYKIFIGLKKISNSEKNTLKTESTDGLNEKSLRYITGFKSDETPDLYSDGPEAETEKMSYLLKIFFEDELESLHNYSYFPVAVIEKDGDSIRYADNYEPPYINISGPKKIYTQILNLKENIISRCRQLEEYKNTGGSGKVAVKTEYLSYILALRTLNRYLPLLDSYLKFKNLHPWSMYLLLTQIAGELSTFSSRINSLGETKSGVSLIPQYNHENIAYCFTQIIKLNQELLDEIIIGPEHIIFLEKNDAMFEGEIPAEAFDRRNSFYLAVKTAENESDLLNEITEISKLASKNRINTLIERSLPGAKLSTEEILPPGLPKKSDCFYFRINTSDSIFENIKKEKSIVFYYEGAPEDAVCEIIVVRNG
ncbi:MAG: type VI secretion system baseplate subunit TssK [Thermodesulfobacteriota bacterium]